MGIRESTMKIGIVGLWHLGSVTSACLVKVGFNVFAYDSDGKNIKFLQLGKALLFDPGLDELIQSGIANKKLVESC